MAARWWRFVRRLFEEIGRDQLPLAAAGIAFFALLALVPALIALISVYALVTDPQNVRDQLQPLLSAIPGSAGGLVNRQLKSVTALGSGGLTFGLVASVFVVLSSTSTAMSAVISGLNRAFNEQETRGFLRVRALALLLTLGALVVAAVSLGALAVLPIVLNLLRVPGDTLWIVDTARWGGLVLLLGGAISVLYRFGPDREHTRRRWFSWGVFTALALWLAGSAAFAVYVENFSRYEATYGTLAALVVLLLWLYLSAFAVLVGAEVDSVRAERRAAPPGPRE
ncbi:membrane protein [Prauserella shujinwangii]|uniref:Membrane protein n=1 Tax=Prauserella shujinwangii TaxID=1453103 RepID=A0A2T0LLA6_9PSEU|nr:YihY/virulence factor BrkB family protein [Prauserella shujinwangii]PRX43692.1 membrane protein [Prauserella shujinwangii]